MSQTSQALKVALAAAEQLSPKLQRELARHLLDTASSDDRTVVLILQHLPPAKQERLTRLMDKSNEGQLSPAERTELKRLGGEVDELLLANSQAMAQALRPELFDQRGRPVKKRFQQL